MPIEIKELLIEINVSNSKETAKPAASGKVDQESVKEYIDQVLTIIDNRKER